VKAAVQKQLEDLRAQAQARVNALVGADQGKLSELVNGRAGAAAQKAGLKDKQIRSAQDQLQKALNGLVQKQGVPGGADLKKLFKKK
jgi:hypothetical protein